MKKKIFYILMTILAVSALVGGGQTLSYFTTQADIPSNRFTAGTVIIDAGDAEGELVVKDNANGECKEVELTIKNSGSKYAYVRAAFDGSWRAAYHKNTANVTASYELNGTTYYLNGQDSSHYIDGSYTGESQESHSGSFSPLSWFTAFDTTFPLVIKPTFQLYSENTSLALTISPANLSSDGNTQQGNLNLQNSNIELQNININNSASGPPTVNGLFYGDDDYLRYTLIGISDPNSPNRNSKLYYYLDGTTLYVAMVVDRSVNDNVFDDKKTAYMESAGWNPPHSLTQLINSEFMGFELLVGDCYSWTWNQGYADYDAVNDLWYSNENSKNSSGIFPAANYQSASSIVWNMNTYESLDPNDRTWNMYVNGTSQGLYKSPFQVNFPDDVTKADLPDYITPANIGDYDISNYPNSYPPVGQITFSKIHNWEWSMVYEYSVDLSDALANCNSNTISLGVGNAHHSPAKDGGPEDEKVTTYDFGDLPAPYPTTKAANDNDNQGGARHQIVINGAYLGNVPPDPEPNGQPNISATGDDINGLDDEDGIVFLTPLVPGKPALIQVTAGTAGYLSAWIDFNGNGTLTQLNLISAIGPALVSPGPVGDLHLPAPGTYTFRIQVPVDATGVMYSRWRFTNEAGQGGNSITGLAHTGEVEDYALASIGDYVWYDVNYNGIQDVGESSASGVVVILLDGNGNPVLDGNGDPVTTITNASGYYEFPGVIPGVEYKVKFVAPAGYAFTEQDQGTDDTKDSDPDPASGITGIYVLGPGEKNTTVDAGLIIPPASLVFKKYVSLDKGDTWFAADNMPGPVLGEGQEPMFKFVVTNTGTVLLVLNKVEDDIFGIIYDSAVDETITLEPYPGPGNSKTFYFPNENGDWGTTDWKQYLDVAIGDVSVDFCESFDKTNWVFYEGYYYYTKPLAPEETVNLCIKVCPTNVPEIYKDFVFISLQAYADAIQATNSAVYKVWFEGYEEPYPVIFEPKPSN